MDNPILQPHVREIRLLYEKLKLYSKLGPRTLPLLPFSIETGRWAMDQMAVAYISHFSFSIKNEKNGRPFSIFHSHSKSRKRDFIFNYSFLYT